MRMKPAELTAVHEKDGLALLELLGVGESFRAGTLVCAVCRLPLRDRGIGAAARDDDEVRFACAKLDCLEEFYTA
jgi:hypothetical protein